jgi:predicted RNA-binding protein YlxR (DUF448 family)
VSRDRHVPVRTCVGCGQPAPQSTLLRVSTAPDGDLVLVTGRRHVGRSGYLHRQPRCWEQFTMRKGPVRSLGRHVDKATRLTFVEELKRID